MDAPWKGRSVSLLRTHITSDHVCVLLHQTSDPSLTLASVSLTCRQPAPSPSAGPSSAPRCVAGPAAGPRLRGPTPSPSPPAAPEFSVSPERAPEEPNKGFTSSDLNVLHNLLNQQPQHYMM